MSMISEQVKELRNYEKIFKGDRIDGNLSPIFGNAANTIELLSQKLKDTNCDGEWIYCGDKNRLPNESGEYNAIVSDYEIFTTMNFEKEDNTWFDKYGNYREVIAWWKVWV